MPDEEKTVQSTPEDEGKQISDMLGTAFANPPNPGEESKDEEKTVSTAEETQEEKVPAADADETPKKTEDAGETETEKLQADNESLRGQLNTLAAQLRDKVQTPDLEKKVAPKEVPVEVAAMSLTEDELSEAQSDPAKLLELLNKVATHTHQTVLQSLPGVVSQTVNRQVNLTQSVREFYGSNPGLAEHADYVSFIITQVQGQHPDWEVPAVLVESADRAYKQLGIQKTALDAENQRRENTTEEGKPSFAKKPRTSQSRSATQEEIEGQAKQIADMMAATG